MTRSGEPSRMIGRYSMGGLVASGGMAAVHLGLARGAVGFARTVAIKRMHPQYASEPDFASMFADEARLAARIRHPNVVSTLDVVLQGENLFIVMEYIQGVTLAQLVNLAGTKDERIPPNVAVAIARDMLHGLHAAHEAVDAEGRPLGIVHRDVSPQNVIVGVDGIARVLDFGIAKANVRLHQTREGGGPKGKLAYMAPEQLEGAPVVRQSDVFAASVVLWEALTGQRAFAGGNEGEVVTKLLRGPPAPPSAVRPELGTDYDAVVMRGLARSPGDRFETARDMASALANVSDAATAAEVGAWVERIATKPLAERTAHVRELETELESDAARLGFGDGDAHADSDPDGTRPATPAALTDSQARSPSAEAMVEQRAAPASRMRVAALVVVACGLTALAVHAWADRRATLAPAGEPAAASTGIASTMTAASIAPMPAPSTPSPAEVDSAPAPAATTRRRATPSATTTSATAMPPRPARAPRPSIPDHL